MTRISKRKALKKVERFFNDCHSCSLCRTRKNVVHWRGSSDAKLCLIGEAPGADEDEAGSPFVGRAGKALDKLLIKAGLDVNRDVFIINMLGCRPPQNRNPRASEIKECKSRLELMINIVKPKMLLLLGRVPASFLTGINVIKPWRGEVTDTELNTSFQYTGSQSFWEDAFDLKVYPSIVTYHPSYFLRNGQSKKLEKLIVSDIKKAWELSK